MLWVLIRSALVLEVPHQGTSNEYPQYIFCGEIRNIEIISCWQKVLYLWLCAADSVFIAALEYLIRLNYHTVHFRFTNYWYWENLW